MFRNLHMIIYNKKYHSKQKARAKKTPGGCFLQIVLHSKTLRTNFFLNWVCLNQFAKQEFMCRTHHFCFYIEKNILKVG